VEHYLENLQMSKRSRYNHRGVIGTFLNFAREKGYLPATFNGLKRAPRRTRFIRQIRVFTPADMATLLNAAKPELVSALAITAFAGVRAEEVKRLDWRQVKLEKGYIEISAAIAKNKIRRFAPITPNLAAWLASLHQQHGVVCRYKNLSNQYLKLAGNMGVKWLRNGLRHSFVSYRFAAIGNVYQVSNESGHTVKELQTDYLEIVEKELAAQWFSIAPAKTPGKPSNPASEGSTENSASGNGRSPL
jgi:integrase